MIIIEMQFCVSTNFKLSSISLNKVHSQTSLLPLKARSFALVLSKRLFSNKVVLLLQQSLAKLIMSKGGRCLWVGMSSTSSKRSRSRDMASAVSAHVLWRDWLSFFSSCKWELASSADLNFFIDDGSRVG